MKIDFNGPEMTVKFDKVPNFLYFNEEGRGCGQVYLNGVRRKGLQNIKIVGKTKDAHLFPPLMYRIQYCEPGAFSSPQFISNMKEELCIGIKILDLDVFGRFLEKVKSFISDERIPETIRQEYLKSLEEFTDGSKKEE